MGCCGNHRNSLSHVGFGARARQLRGSLRRVAFRLGGGPSAGRSVNLLLNDATVSGNTPDNCRAVSPTPGCVA